MTRLSSEKLSLPAERNPRAAETALRPENGADLRAVEQSDRVKQSPGGNLATNEATALLGHFGFVNQRFFILTLSFVYLA